MLEYLSNSLFLHFNDQALSKTILLSAEYTIVFSNLFLMG